MKLCLFERDTMRKPMAATEPVPKDTFFEVIFGFHNFSGMQHIQLQIHSITTIIHKCSHSSSAALQCVLQLSKVGRCCLNEIRI